jgi:hypothetical protein
MRWEGMTAACPTKVFAVPASNPSRYNEQDEGMSPTGYGEPGQNPYPHQ